MKKLIGEITAHRLYGEIKNGGGALQKKHVEPTTSIQEVVADPEFYGLLSVTVGSLPPVAEEEYFGGTSIEEQYLIQGETLENIATAIQNKKETTAFFTPEQMAVEIDTIVTGDNLPLAEYASFGTASMEYGIIGYAKADRSNPSYNMQSMYRFEPTETFAVYGFRAYLMSQVYASTNTLKLWNSAKEQIASVTVKCGSSQGWTEEVFLGTPINLLAGETYYLSIYGKGSCLVTQAQFNHKINVTGVATISASSSTTWPSSFSKSTTVDGVADMIIGPAITESVIQEYKIQTDTLDSIASEVQRITGVNITLTPERIISALAAMPAQTSS